LQASIRKFVVNRQRNMNTFRSSPLLRVLRSMYNQADQAGDEQQDHGRWGFKDLDILAR
jgi:hypothetical protein